MASNDQRIAHDQAPVLAEDKSGIAAGPTHEDSTDRSESPDSAAYGKDGISRDGKKRNGGLGPVALIFACGGALFSDGYVNANSGPTNTILQQIPKYNTTSRLSSGSFSKLYSSLAFAGTLVGIFIFGIASDRIGRKFGMVFASIWLTLFSILIAGAWGAGGNPSQTLVALEAYRFLLGIAIGAEYPAGSVAASENTESKDVNPKRQQMYFQLATNTMIDFGFVVSTLVAFILYHIFGDNHLEWVWRLTLGLGAIPPLSVLFFRVKMEEPEHFKRGAIKKNVPWLLIIRKYWVSLSAVSISWFIYDWVSYPASLYSSFFVSKIVPGGNLGQSLGWATLINAFYIPGTLAGALVSDRLGPKNTMIIGLVCQAIIGFGLAGGFGHLRDHIASVVVLYGFYVAFGEFGPGNNLGLLASKAVAPTAVRGSFYAIAAIIGKVGAFTGTYVYTSIQSDVAPEGSSNNLWFSVPFYIGSSLAFFSAALVFFFVPPVTQDCMWKNDREFEEYLAAHGYDMANIGLAADKTNGVEHQENRDAAENVKA